MLKLTASFLDFLLEELDAGFWWVTPWPWEAVSTWEDTGWAAGEDFKETDGLSCGIILTSEDPGLLVWSGVAWELWASLVSKFFLLATLFFVTFRE